MSKIFTNKCNVSRVKPINLIKFFYHPLSGTKRKLFVKDNPILLKKYSFVPKPKNLYKIPVFIISYNRLSYIKQMVTWLKKYGINNIHIIDNNSSYGPLLKYLQTCQCTVHRLDKNWGHEVLWRCGKFNKVIKKSLYIVSDPDIAPNKNLPKDFLLQMYNILGQYKNITKIGFALDITDIRKTKTNKKYIKSEQIFWKKKIKNEKLVLYDAPIDTTFALYRPGKLRPGSSEFYRGIRVAGNFTAKHLPWYIDPNKETREDIYYRKHANPSISNWAKDSDKEKK